MDYEDSERFPGGECRALLSWEEFLVLQHFLGDVSCHMEHFRYNVQETFICHLDKLGFA